MFSGKEFRIIFEFDRLSMLMQKYSLGDRHGENILFEEGSGGVLHVDFNCLFDKVWAF